MTVHVYRNRPDDDRDRSKLHFCTACNGWYGVPHNDSHCQGGYSPRFSREQCACAPCRTASHKTIQGAFGFFTDAPEWQP